MKVLIVFGFITLLLVPTALAQQPCSQTVAQAAAQRAKAVRTTLLAIKPEGDGLEPELRQQIQKLKDKLAATADASLHCATVATTAEKLQNELQSLLNANKTPKKPQWQDDSNAVDDDYYGADLNVKVSRAGDKTSLILVVFNFGIVCGDDSMLLGYVWKQEKWIRVLRWQSDPDRTPNAFGDFFDYRVVQQQNSANWLVGVAHGHPMCTSNFGRFDLDFIQPARNDIPQKVLLHKEEIYWRDDPVKMKLTPDGLELRVSGYSRDISIICRPGIYRYRISGDQIDRVQPIAINGRDFVDEWLNSPWNESKNWNSPSELAGLEATHKIIKDLHDSDYNPKKFPNFTYGPVRPCSDSASHFQVEFDKGWWVEEKNDWRPDTPTFFQIQEGKNSFTMLSASDKPDTHCTGHDIMPKQ